MSRWRTWTPATNGGGGPVPAAATADEVPDWAAAEIERPAADGRCAEEAEDDEEEEA